ncbi:hypothetical protein [Methanoregula sp.]|uniref:hypothetical protein n=1 Tax=Methanoregula sp. TaxID=2052170 RepID=UPI003565948B
MTGNAPGGSIFSMLEESIPCSSGEIVFGRWERVWLSFRSGGRDSGGYPVGECDSPYRCNGCDCGNGIDDGRVFLVIESLSGIWPGEAEK